MSSLVIISEEHNGKVFELSGSQTIGRHSDCEIIIGDGHVSGRHARLDTTNGQVTIEDLDSSNGTYINGNRINTHALQQGDEIRIASTTFRYTDSPHSSVSPTRTLASHLKAGNRGDLILYGPGQENQSPVNSGKIKVSDEADDNIAFNENMDAGESLAIGLRGSPTSRQKSAAQESAANRLEALVQLGTHLATTTDIRAISQIILDQMFENLPQADRGFLMLTDPDDPDGELIVRAMRNRNLKPGQESVIEVSRTVLREAMNHKAILFSAAEGADDDVLAGAASIGHLQISSIMCVPMELNREILGLLYISTKNRRKAFTKDDMGLLSIVATQAAIAIQNRRLAEEMSEIAQIRNTMERYLSPGLVDQVVTGQLALEMGGVRKEGTILFSDLISFSKWSLDKPPVDVMSLLNDYLQVMETVIFDNGGTIDKTMGDAIMAMWGVLIDAPDAAAMSVAAALRMQNRQYVLRNKMHADGDSVPGMGIGINTGELVAGNMGSEHKVEYTVLGKNVNMAQRLESLAGFGQTFISSGTHDIVKDKVCALSLPDVTIKGWDSHIPVYSVRGIRRDNEEGETSILTSIPLVSAPPADWPATAPDYIGVIVLLDENVEGLPVHAWLWNSVEEGQEITIQPFLQEKAVPALTATVTACRLIQDESLGDYFRATLHVTNPPDIFTELLQPGNTIPSDWTKPEDIIRA